MDKITCKFGGTSLADAGRIKAVAEIVQSDPRRRFIVPSAPGKRNADDKKITDLLIAWFHMLQDGLEPDQPRRLVQDRFCTLRDELGVDVDIESHFAEIDDAARNYATVDYLASRGEYLNARLLAELFGAQFVDPSGAILFTPEGMLDPKTYDTLGKLLEGDGLFVVPGFYGTDHNGDIRTFSRGGSDVTGSIVARASGSILYENWTDVSGIRMTDPRIVPDARRIDEITYGELRELAYMGAEVVHDEAIFPLIESKIPMNIRNTNDPENPGTMILSARETTRPVCGIAARAGFTMINIEKTLMNREIGFAWRALSVLEQHRVSFEHMPSGIDTISLIIKDEELDRNGAAVVEGINRVCRPDRITLAPGLALIATVGQAMNHHVGVAARLCTALAEAGVNLRVLDQGSSEMNIIVGVEEHDIVTAVQAIYTAFQDWN